MKANIAHIASQRRLHKIRQLERELLQQESKQPNFPTFKALNESLTPTVRKQLILRRLGDNSKHGRLSPNNILNYRNLPNKQLRILLTPSIIKADLCTFLIINIVACKRIASKITQDKQNVSTTRSTNTLSNKREKEYSNIMNKSEFKGLILPQIRNYLAIKDFISKEQGKNQINSKNIRKAKSVNKVRYSLNKPNAKLYQEINTEMEVIIHMKYRNGEERTRVYAIHV